MNEIEIQARIAALEAERDTLVETSNKQIEAANKQIEAFTDSANRRVSFLEGKIEALRDLIAPPAPPEQSEQPAPARTPRGRPRPPAVADAAPIEPPDA